MGSIPRHLVFALELQVQVVQTMDVYGGDSLAQIAVYLFNPGQKVHSYKQVCDIGTEFQNLNGPESSLEIIGGNPSGTGCWITTITCPGKTPTHLRIYPNLHTRHGHPENDGPANLDVSIGGTALAMRAIRQGIGKPNPISDKWLRRNGHTRTWGAV